MTPFERQVKRALRLYDDPERLGQESPLASAYFLSRALRQVARPVTARNRGEVLCAEIRAAAGQIWKGPPPRSREELLEAIKEVRRNPDDPRYAYIVLELRCLHSLIAPYRTSDIWEQPHLLPGSKSQHYRDFDVAIKRLAAILLERLRPAIRPEQPRPPDALYGYDQQLAALTAALAQGGTAVLQGASGTGKTSIGALSVRQLGNDRAFWYTIHPGFNDGPSSLLFALGAFLFERGAANLWQYLVTTNGEIKDLHLALGLLREDLATFKDQPPILCFDDLEHLNTSNLGLLPLAHAQLLTIIEGLRGITPLLLISQRSLAPGDLNLELSGLSIDDLEGFWQAAGRRISRQQAERLHRYTGGNLRMLTLLLALGDDDAELFIGEQEPGSVRSLLPIFQRLWRSLLPEERRSLQRLSVYTGYAPEDLFPAALLESLTRLRLIERDNEGGITILPVLAPILRDELSRDRWEALHREAALVRLERGEYTAAAYHFAQGEQEYRAVQVWFPVRQQAIARGEADTARLIFSDISRQRLDRPECKALDIILAELSRLAGQHEDALRKLEQADWVDESQASARLWMLRGEMQDALGYPDQALTSYARGIEVTTTLLGQLTALHQCRALLFVRRRKLTRSWQEFRRAEFALELSRGLLRDAGGEYDAALEAYSHARTVAEELDDDALRAQAERLIAAVYGRRQQLDQALEHASRGLAIYERLNDRVNLEKLRSNLASIYVQARQFQAALEVGVPAYSFFVAVGDPYFAAVTAANLAESAYELGDFATAQRYATAVLELRDQSAAPYAHFTLGQINLARNELAAALEHFNHSILQARQNDDLFMVAYAQRACAQTYRAAGQIQPAQRELNAALTLFRQMNIAGEISRCEELLAELAVSRAV